MRNASCMPARLRRRRMRRAVLFLAGSWRTLPGGGRGGRGGPIAQASQCASRTASTIALGIMRPTAAQESGSRCAGRPWWFLKLRPVSAQQRHRGAEAAGRQAAKQTGGRKGPELWEARASWAAWPRCRPITARARISGRRIRRALKGQSIRPEQRQWVSSGGQPWARVREQSIPRASASRECPEQHALRP